MAATAGGAVGVPVVVPVPVPSHHTLPVRAHRGALPSFIVPPRSRQPVKVFCDIDDTFYASLYDHSFPRNTIYPGVQSFFHALRCGHCPISDLRAGLVFLSARVDAMRDHTVTMLQRRGAGRDLVLLTGQVVDWLSHQRMAARKYTNFQRCVVGWTVCFCFRLVFFWALVCADVEGCTHDVGGQ